MWLAVKYPEKLEPGRAAYLPDRRVQTQSARLSLIRCMPRVSTVLAYVVQRRLSQENENQRGRFDARQQIADRRFSATSYQPLSWVMRVTLKNR